MAEYPSNSYINKPSESKSVETPKIEPVVNHEVQIRKRSIFQKFANMFIAEDMNSIKEYVVQELLIPGIKKAFLSTMEMMLNGKGYNRKINRETTSISYRNYWPEEKAKGTSVDDSRASAYPDFDDIIFSDRGDAEYVLAQMKDILARYHVVHLSDMFELSKRPAPYTGMRYGWTDISTAKPVPTRGGYVIKMPRPIPIDRN